MVLKSIVVAFVFFSFFPFFYFLLPLLLPSPSSTFLPFLFSLSSPPVADERKVAGLPVMRN
jgi:hypothetical protein